MNIYRELYSRYPESQELIEKIRRAKTLAKMILNALQLAFLLAIKIVETDLFERAQTPTEWPNCPECGRRLNSKGFVPRQITSLIGEIRWRRRVGRCPNRCHIGQIAPLDRKLGLSSHQTTSVELCKIGGFASIPGMETMCVGKSSFL